MLFHSRLELPYTYIFYYRNSTFEKQILGGQIWAVSCQVLGTYFVNAILILSDVLGGGEEPIVAQRQCTEGRTSSS